jgi:predicted SprT family Zn-dependent metalloprotease
MKEKELELLVSEVAKNLESIGIPISKNIKGVSINKRARKRLGACKIEKSPYKEDCFIIEISAVSLDLDLKHLKDIIAHELLHTCDGCFNHGEKWKKFTIKAKAMGYDISRTVSYETLGIDNLKTKESVKYKVKCQNCGHVYERKRMCQLIKTPKKYRCGLCGGALDKL